MSACTWPLWKDVPAEDRLTVEHIHGMYRGQPYEQTQVGLWRLRLIDDSPLCGVAVPAFHPGVTGGRQMYARCSHTAWPSGFCGIHEKPKAEPTVQRKRRIKAERRAADLAWFDAQLRE